MVYSSWPVSVTGRGAHIQPNCHVGQRNYCCLQTHLRVGKSLSWWSAAGGGGKHHLNLHPPWKQEVRSHCGWETSLTIYSYGNKIKGFHVKGRLLTLKRGDYDSAFLAWGLELLLRGLCQTSFCAVEGRGGPSTVDYVCMLCENGRCLNMSVNKIMRWAECVTGFKGLARKTGSAIQHSFPSTFPATQDGADLHENNLQLKACFTPAWFLPPGKHIKKNRNPPKPHCSVGKWGGGARASTL